MPLNPLDPRLPGTVPSVVPFTIRETPSLLHLVEEMRKWIVTVLTPFVNDAIDEFGDEFTEEVNRLIGEVNAKIIEIESLADAVEGSVTDAEAAKTAAELAVTAAEAARDLAQAYAEQAQTVPDGAMAGVLADPLSASRVTLDGLYARVSDLAALAVTVTAKADTSYVDAELSAKADADDVADEFAALSNVYAPMSVFTMTDSGRLSEAYLDNRYAVSAGSISAKSMGAHGNGLSDDTQALQDVINLAALNGVSVFFPVGTYLLKGSLAIRDNMRLIGNGATLLKTSGTDAKTVFHADSIRGTGYGAGASNWSIQGFKIQGALPSITAAIQLHHVNAATISDCLFLDAGGENHSIDMQGCSNVTVIRCEFSGQTRGEADKEAVQVDHSARSGATKADLTETYDGLPCTMIRVQDCKTSRSTTGEAPNLVGSHSFVRGQFHRRIYVVDNEIQVSMDRNPVGPSSRGAVHFVMATDVYISGNTFRCLGGANQHAIKFRTGSTVIELEDVGSVSPVPTTDVFSAPGNIHISDNTFADFNTGDGTYICHLFGLVDSGSTRRGSINGVTFMGNSFRNAGPSGTSGGTSGMVCLRAEFADGLTFVGNSANRYRTVLHAVSCDSVAVHGNTFEGGRFRAVTLDASNGVSMVGNVFTSSATTDSCVLVTGASKGIAVGNIIGSSFTATFTGGGSTFTDVNTVRV